jgi:heme/copper-type cytochrome/quinol oxidase subunit 2
VRRFARVGGLLSLLVVALLGAPAGAWACAACYGASDAPMARGMNWGIFSLLGIIVVVLLAVAGFFVFLGRKAAASAAVAASPVMGGPAGAGFDLTPHEAI